MTLLDHPPVPPRLVCGITPPHWGEHAPLGCILDMGHLGRVHQDRMGRSWELLQEFVPRTHHVDIVQRLVALLQGSQQVLERLSLLDSHELYMLTEEIALTERQRIHDTLIAMGLTDFEPKGKAA